MTTPLSREARWLLTEKYHGNQTPAFLADLARLAAGEPLAYLIGYQPFLTATIWLDSRPLIPRTETEYWVNHLIRHYSARDNNPTTILDLCAGSGCIGIALGHAFPAATIAFSEIDVAHRATIEKNCQINNLKPSQYRIYSGDLFTPLTTTERFDLIVTNPPYIDPAFDRTTESVRQYEPPLALYGGREGVTIIKEIIDFAPYYLHPQGELWLEHEPEQSETIKQLATAKHFLAHTHRDQFGILRFSRLVLQ